MSNMYRIALFMACAMAAPLVLRGENANNENIKVDKKTAAKLEAIANRPSAPSIKVLLDKDLEGAQVEVKSGHAVYDPYTGKQLSNAFTSASCYMFPTTEGMKWGEEFPGVYQLLIVPKYGSFLLSGIEYHGMLYAYEVDGALAFVNEISIDDYADSVLSAKVPANVTDQEVLSALSIAARTDALYKISQASTSFYDIKGAASPYQGCGITRKDVAFQGALRTTKKMILSQRGSQDKNQGFSIDWFDGSECTAPLEKMTQLAAEGCDANEILRELFPQATIRLAS